MPETAKRICLFGGSFNPIHNQHIQIAKDALKQFSLDKIIFIPTLNPPHKETLGATISDRTRMIELATAQYREMEVSTIESYRSGKSYTIDTIKQIKKEYPSADLYYIIGEDSLNYLDKWYRAKELFALTKFIVCDRFFDQEDRRNEIKALGANLLFLVNKPIDMSSTKIRKDISKQKFSPDVPLAVYEYIIESSLYGANILPAIFKEYLDKLSTLINTKRLAHSLCVAYTARELAAYYDVDPILATCAGILHDCAKALPVPVLQSIAKINRLFFDAEIYQTPLLHAPIGAEIAKEIFNVETPEVISAITYHTTGIPGMSVLDMIVYLADKIEPTRSAYPHLEEIKILAKKNLKKAMILSIETTQNYLRLSNKSLHKNTSRLLTNLRKEY